MLARSCLSVLFLLLTFVAYAQDKSCNTETSRITEFAKSLSISLETADHQVGQSIRLKWARPDHQEISGPSYVAIATSELVRFGKGQFFALMPNADAPYQTSFAAAKTRAVISLSDTGVATGAIEIIPLRAGELKVSWAIVEPPSCQPNAPSTELGHLVVQVNATGAQLVPAEEFSLQRSQEVRRSLDGAREILVFKNSYQVVDVVSGESLIRREGRNPVFSPTGRFLVSETLGEQTIEITDIEADLQIFRGVGRAAAFVHGDSFVAISELGPGATFLRTLQDVRLDDQKYQAPSANSEDENAGSSSPEPLPTQNGFSLILGDSLGNDRQSGSDGSYGGQRSFRLNIAAGLIAYQERSAWGQKEEDYSESAVEVRSLATMNAIDHSAQIVQDEVTKFTRVPRIRELDAWFPGQKPALVYMIDNEIEGAHLTRAWTSTKQANPKTQILINEQKTRRLKGFTVGNLPIQSASTSVKVTLAEFIGIDGYEALSPTRTSSSKAIARQMERDLSRVYSRKIAKFGPIKSSSYESISFPDPNTTEELETVEIDLSKEGYVIWQWKDAHNRLWFGQTVEAGRRARNFRYHLLMWNGAKAKWADLVEQAEQFSGSNDKTASLETIEVGDFRGVLDSAIHEPATATVIAGRYLAFVPRPSSWIFVFDFQEWKPTCLIERATNAGLTSWITLSKDRQSMLQYNTDGTFSIYSCRTKNIILTGAFLDGEFVALHSTGYFIGSSEAESIVKIKIPGIPGKHYLGQYASQLRRPDLVRQAFGGHKLESPELRLPPRLDAVAVDGIIRLSSDGAAPLTELRLFGDGRLFRRIPLSGSKASVDIQEQELRIYRTVTAVAVDSRGVTSATVRLPANNSQTVKRGTLYVVGLGVDDYRDSQLPRLSFAASDAKGVVASLTSAQGYFKVVSNLLPSRKIDADTVLNALQDVVKTATNADTLVFFFSGHGLRGPAGDLLLALPDTSVSTFTGGLSWDQLAEKLMPSRARVVVILDACHSGLADRIKVSANDEAAARLLTRGGAAMVVLSASKGNQFSEESGSARGGHFSLAFSRILGKDRPLYDLDRNGSLELDELYRGLKGLVMQSTNGRQTPWLSRSSLVGDFALF